MPTVTLEHRTAPTRRVWLPVFVVTLSLPILTAAQTNDLVNRNTPGNGKQLFGSEENRAGIRMDGPFKGTNPVEGPFGLKPSSVKFDKSQIKNFVEQVVGAPEGPIEESELSDLLDAIEQRFGVQIPDRDVILVSGVTAKGLVDAVQKSVIDKNVGQEKQPFLFRKSKGQKAEWSELSLPEKQAVLVQLQNANLQTFQNPESDSLRVYDRKYTRSNLASGDKRGFYPNGNQETSPYAMTYERDRKATEGEKQQARDEYKRIMQSLESQRDFYKNGPSIKFLKAVESKDPERKGFYSNGKSRFDAAGNEVYANGARKINDVGIPLYSNGRPKVDMLGNPLFSNGRRKTTDDGKILYSDGSVRRTADGVELFRNGKKRWTGDGRMPGSYQDQQQVNERQRNAYNEQRDAYQLNPSIEIAAINPKTQEKPRPDAAQKSENRATFKNGRPQMTEDGVQLHANGKKRFSGDGIGDNPFGPPELRNDNRTPLKQDNLPYNKSGLRDLSQRKAAFVAELYPNGKRTYGEQGDRLYDNGKSRTNDQNAFLFKNGRELTTAGNRALTPTGERVNATSGFQGRPQGKFPVFEIMDGAVVKVEDDRIILRRKGDVEGQTYSLGTAKVARISDPPVPGSIDQLSPNLAVQAVSRKMVQFVDGELVESDEEPELYAILASNPKVGSGKIADGRQDVRTIITGRLKTLADGKILVETGPKREVLPITISEDMLLQRDQKGEPTPTEIKYITPGKMVTIVAEQVLEYKDGKLDETGALRALAVIQ